MTPRRGFGRTECVVLIVVVAVLIVAAIIAMEPARRRSRAGWCEGAMRQLGLCLSGYSSDYKGVVAGFSWRAGMPTSRRGGGPAESDMEAVIAQAAELISSESGVPIEHTDDWLPNVNYSLLVTSGYIADLFPSMLNVCPSDTRRQWRSIPLTEAERQGRKADIRREPPDPLPETRSARWMFAASYQVVPAAYSPDEAAATGGTISQGSTDGEYLVPTSRPFGERMRRFDDVAYPAQKVLLMDSHDRHYARSPLFYAHPDARQPLLLFDGSVQTRRTGETNPGFRPNDPSNPRDTEFSYAPVGDAAKWTSPPRDPGGDRGLRGWYRWTRAGLRGRDIGAAAPVRSEPQGQADSAQFVTAEP